jgi:ABC-2 type transport system ATP-binding protein
MNLSTPASIEISGLRVERGGLEVLHGVDLDVIAGSVTGLLGPSGCGKTTLLRSIVGVQRIAAGSVMVLGRDAGTPALRRRVAYLTQAPSVYADLSIAENLAYFATILDAAAGAIDRVLREVGLEGHEGQLVGQLSGGERARVSLASALLGTPEVLILDEPTVGLDPLLREELWDLFHRLAAGGATVVVSSHVMDEAARCNRLVLMREGGLIANDPPDVLLRRTHAEDLSAAFVELVRETARV